MAAGDGQHQDHAQQRADKGGDGEGQQADDFTHMQHHNHCAQGGAAGHAQQVRVGQGVARHRLQHRADQRQPGAHQRAEQHAWHADQPHDMFLARAPVHLTNTQQLVEQNVPHHVHRHPRRAKTQRHHARHQQQRAQGNQQQGVAASDHCGWKPLARVSMASTLSMPGVACT